MPPLANGPSFAFVSTEAVLGGGTLLLLFLGLILRRPSRHLPAGLALLVLGAALVCLATTAGPPQSLFGGLLARDPFGDYFTAVAAMTTAVVILLSLRARDTLDLVRGDCEAPELFALLLAAALGCALMARATDLLLAYLAIELTSIASYVLAGFTPGARRSAEASLKYVVFGGVASGAMLYGMSLLYGLSAATSFAAIREAAGNAPPPLVLVAVVLCLAGLGYKIAVVPFHMWCPDVYEGAPTPVTAFLSVAPKAAGFALALRFFTDAVPGLPTSGGRSLFALLLLGVAAATMTIGNLAALGQRNVKRLLAYSSIAHAGYLALGLAAGMAGAKAVLIYVGVYFFMNLGAFAVVAIAEDRAGLVTVDDYAGFGARAPLGALALTVCLFSLTGLPPTGGFVGKYYLFAALIEQGHAGGGGAFYLLALLGVANSVLSLTYYARWIRALYFVAPRPDARPLALTRGQTLLLLVLAVPVVLLGVAWGPLDGAVDFALRFWPGG